MESGQKNIEQSAGPGPVGRRPDAVAWLREKIVMGFDTREMPDQYAVTMQGAFRLAGRTGRVDHNRGIVG